MFLYSYVYSAMNCYNILYSYVLEKVKGGTKMENSGKVFEEFNNLHGLELSPILNNQEFLIELVRLTHAGIEKVPNTGVFENKKTRLLEYVIRTEDSELALLLTETLLKIQTHTKLSLFYNEINLTQLCDLFAIQFDQFKTDIYFNTLKLINYLEVTHSKKMVIQ